MVAVGVEVWGALGGVALGSAGGYGMGGPSPNPAPNSPKTMKALHFIQPGQAVWDT